MNLIEEAGRLRSAWSVTRYENDAAFRARRPSFVRDPNTGLLLPPVSRFEKNILLNEGIAVLLDLAFGLASPAAFSNANAYLGAGSGPTPSALTGTLTFSNGSTSVTGSGTSFTGELAVGDLVRLDADDVFAEVDSIGSDTALTLTANYAGAGGAGAGSKVPKATATDTDLVGSSKTYAAVNGGYPSRAAQTVTLRADFGDGVGVHRWLEATVANASSGTGDNLNRKAQDLGTKGATGTWTLELQITLS